jgi:hypothetical protein
MVDDGGKDDRRMTEIGSVYQSAVTSLCVSKYVLAIVLD